MTQLIDEKQRQQALEPTHSFIVQAPAGSGKTELLTQRYLNLLQTVATPEEIIALTFTRKAAYEMRARILQALQRAASEPEPESTHERITYQLAKAALQRDQKLHWDLLKNANRMRVLTIDALCSQLVGCMPILTQFATKPIIDDRYSQLYQQACQDLILSLQQSPPWDAELRRLLLYLDNDAQKVEGLLIAMLATRDQWLTHVINHNPREVLEQALQHVISDHLNGLDQLIPAELCDELLALARFAASQCHQNGTSNPITVCLDLESLPELSVEFLPEWQALANLLITKDFAWRKQVIKPQGFPAASTALNPEDKQLWQQMKERMLRLINRLSEVDGLLVQFSQVMQCPNADYAEDKWAIIEALLKLLPVLVAKLHLLFKQHGFVDYTEVNLQALHALGDADCPSDLALALDYRISHLLVDEFQDTSSTQFHLLEALTAGWQAGDKRTLFLVGDPMQSIYRFRKAEVGLFLQAWQQGLNHVALTPLRLQTNFRSQEKLVQWVNQQCQSIFPHESMISLGAIDFYPASAMHPGEAEAVSIHARLAEEQFQGQRIVKIIQQSLQENPSARIAILVRARSHLQTIIPQLKQANINYIAQEIDNLAARQIIQDLESLTRALLCLDDRIAWLALLRSPYFALSLADLLTLVNFDDKACIWQQLQNWHELALSQHTKSRLEKTLAILQHSIKQRKRQSLTTLVENTWIALGGPACCEDQSDLSDVKRYFALLRDHEQGGELVDLEFFAKQLAGLAAASNLEVEGAVEIMTIHKSKGLEFDVVILPGLERPSKIDAHPLLLWQERTSFTHGCELLLAPIRTEYDDKTYNYLRRIEFAKANNELMRLLYVAFTRAKLQLHLLANLQDNDLNEIKKPAHGSLLELLWPNLSNEFIAAATQHQSESSQQQDATEITTNSVNTNLLKRLPADWQSPIDCNFANYELTDKPPRLQLTDAKTEALRHIGIVTHLLLQQLAEQALLPVTSPYSKQQINGLLLQAGVSTNLVDDAASQVASAINNTLSDSTGRWILGQHQDAHSEWSISHNDNDQIKHLIIDRSFIADGIRWIIDFKTSVAHDRDEISFLQHEKQQYQSQLQTYANALTSISDTPIHVGLYFPLLSKFVKWEFDRYFFVLG